jgi:hypothetical protein
MSNALRFNSRAGLLVLVMATTGLIASGAYAQSAPGAPTQATVISFADATSLSTDATSMSLHVESRPAREYPHVMYRAPFTYEQATRAWAERHFSLSGNSVNSLRVTLRDGDITEKLLPRTRGIKGLFTKDQAAEYEAHLDIEVAIVDPNGKVLVSTDSKAWHTRTVPEGTTEEQKRGIWADMMKTTFDNLDAELQPRIRTALAGYVH